MRHSVTEPFRFKLVSRRVVAEILALLALALNQNEVTGTIPDGHPSLHYSVHALPIPARTSTFQSMSDDVTPHGE